MSSITDGQLEIGTDGLVVGAGTDYPFPVDLFQWWGGAEVRTSDQARGASDGYLAGRDLLGKHVSTLQVIILATSESDLGGKIEAWKAACRATADTLVTVRANLFGRTRTRYGRFRIPGEVQVDQWSLVQNAPISGIDCDRLRAYGSAQFETLDPRTYGDTLYTASCGPTQPGAGFTVPFTPPFGPAAGTEGAFTATNLGQTEAPWKGTLTGPLTFPEISHLESGKRLALDFSANGGVDLSAGETLVLNSADRSVLANGIADRRSQLTIDSTWWDLDVGDNTFQLDAAAGNGTLTVEWRDTYLS